MANITPEGILAELENVIRSMPSRATMHHDIPENIEWLGYATAVFDAWAKLTSNIISAAEWNTAVKYMHARQSVVTLNPTLTVIRLLYQAQSSLRMTTIGPVSVAIGQGKVFQYFDEVRKIVEEANSEILFIDPYLNTDFIARYLPYAKPSVGIRLLGSKNINALKVAAQLFANENGRSIEVKEGKGIHDRWMFLDKRRCFQSGASFKDGALNAGTTLTENVDTFTELQAHYEGIWSQS